MPFNARPTSGLIEIAIAGGGFRLTAGMRPLNDLVKIAQSAKSSGARVIFTGVEQTSLF